MGTRFIIIAGCMLAACSPQQGSTDRPFQEVESEQESGITQPKNGTEPVAGDTNLRAFFGNLHVHSGWSYDTHLIGTPATPDDAYRFAKGEEIALANGARVRLQGLPLDFMAVTDHAEYLGVLFKHTIGETMLPVDEDPILQKIFRGTAQEKDEWATFELLDKSWAELYAPETVDRSVEPAERYRGSYVRSAYKRGLDIWGRVKTCGDMGILVQRCTGRVPK